MREELNVTSLFLYRDIKCIITYEPTNVICVCYIQGYKPYIEIQLREILAFSARCILPAITGTFIHAGDRRVTEVVLG